MSFDNKYYPNRKDWRKPLRGAKRVDRSCRNHGSCSYCQSSRTHKNDIREASINEQIEEFFKKLDEIFGELEN